MKKILFIIILAIGGLTGCSDYLDVNEDPNNPNDVDINLIIPSAQGFIATRIGGEMFNYCGIFAQYVDQAPEANQYNEISEYRFTNSIFNNDYTYLYAGALEDIERIKEKTTEVDDWGNYFMATVLRAYVFQIVVDMIDQAPYTEALQGGNIPMPKWDSGESIYTGILTELDDAEAKLTNESSIDLSDMLLDADIDQWIGFANALRLKILMRTSYAQDNSSAIMALVNENNFFTGDIAFSSYETTVGRENPWYSTNNMRGKTKSTI